MADTILKLKISSQEYDSKLKQATTGLTRYVDQCRKAGGTLEVVEKETLDYVRALGQMDTTSRTATGKLAEMKKTFVELSAQYKQMTDAEKASPFGRALSQSLDELKPRIMETKRQLDDINKSMSDTSSGGKGGFLSGMGDKMGGALQVFGGNMMTKAAGAVAGLASEMYDMMQQGVELARQGEGIRIAFERLGRGDILDGLREATHGTVTDLELMKAAVKFNDFKLPLDELGILLQFAQQKAKDTGQSVDYMVESITTGLGRKSLMILDNLGLSASEIKERMKETGDMTKAVGDIIRDQMSKAGDYVETAADRAQQATVAQQNKMEELGRKIMPLAEESAAMWNSIKIGGLSVIANVLDPMISKFTHLGRLMAAQGMSSNGGGGSMNRMIGMLGNGQGDNARSTYNRQVAAFNRSISARRADVSAVERWQRGERSQELKGTMNRLRDMYGADFQRVVRDNLNATINNLNEYKKRAQQLMSSGAVTIPVSDTTPTTPTGGTRSTSSASRQQTEMQQNQTRINDLTQQYVTLMAAASEAGKPLTDEQQKQTAEIQRQIAELEKRNGQLKLYQEQAQGKLLGPDAFRQQLSVDVAVNNKKIEELEKQLLSLNGITIDPKTVTITATDEALPKLREIQGITIDDKTMTVTAATQEALQAIQSVDGVTIDTKNVKVTAETDEARQKLEELKRQIAELKDQNIQITAAMGSIGMPLSEMPRMGVTDAIYGKGNNQFVPAPLMPSMSDVVRQRGGNLLDEKAMKAVNEDISKNLPNAKEKDSPMESGKKLLNGISQLTDGLEKIGIDIPDEVQAVIGVIQGVMQIIEAVNTIIGVTQVTALTANTVAMGALTSALWANTATSFFGLQNGGIVPKFADGGLIGRAALGIAIPGNSMSGDNLRLPVDGGRGVIGVNSGEVILNRAQQGNLISQMEGGLNNLHLETSISMERLRIGLTNNSMRRGKGEYVTSNKR